MHIFHTLWGSQADVIAQALCSTSQAKRKIPQQKDNLIGIAHR